MFWTSQIFEYFVNHYSSISENTMLQNICSDFDQGFTIDIFTTSASESLNAVIIKRLNYKESEWPEFNEAMKDIVLSQGDDCVLCGHGQYQLDKEYAHLIISPIYQTVEERLSFERE